MIWLLALTVAALVFVVAMPGPPQVRSLWDEPEQVPTDRWKQFREKQERLAQMGGLQMPPAIFLALRFGAAGAGAIAAGWLLGPVSALCGGIAGWIAVQEWVHSRAEARLLEFADHFREVLQSITNSLRAGRSMLQALEQSKRDLERIPGRAHGLMARELDGLLQELSMGAPLDTAIHGLVLRVPLEEVQLFADAVAICRSRGGNLVQVLQTLIRLNVDRFQVRQEVRVQTAEKRLEGAIISVMPVGMLLLLSLISPDYMSPLTGTFFGQALVGIGLLLVLIAYVVTRSITRIEV